MFYNQMFLFKMFLLRSVPFFTFIALVVAMALAYLFLRKQWYRSRKVQETGVILLLAAMLCGMAYEYRSIAREKQVQWKFAHTITKEDVFYKVTAGSETFYFMNPKLKDGEPQFYQNGRQILQPTSVIRYTSLWAEDLFPTEVLEEFAFYKDMDTRYDNLVHKLEQH